MPRRNFRRARRPGKGRVPRAVRTFVQRKIQRNIETKFRLATYSGSNIPDSASTPINTLLNAVGQGDTQNARNGNQIFATGFYGKFVLAAGDSTNIVRVVMYIPKDSQYTFYSSPPGITSLIDQDKFTVLYDRYISLDTYNPQKVLTIARKWNRGSRRGIQCQYSGTGSTESDPSKNPIYIYFVSDSSAVAHPTVTGNFRLYFKDA